MRILIVLEYYPPHTGGVERLFETIAEGLAQRGHAVRIITTRIAGSAKRETRNRVLIERVSVPGASRNLFAFWAIPKVVHAAKWADIIHTSTYTAIVPSSIAGVLKKRPVLITGHERIGRRWFSLPRINRIAALTYYLSEHVLYRFPATLIAAVSEASRRDIIAGGIAEHKVVRVYNAIDDNPWKKRARSRELVERYGLKDRTVFVVYGRPGVSKGVEYAVRAFPLIKERIANATLLLLVSKQPEDGYRTISHELDRIGRDDVIERSELSFPELVEHVNLADVVIVPSLTEGFGFTTYESCLLDKRVVASNIGSIPEVISGRYVLVDPADPESIARGCEKVLSQKTRTEAKRFTIRAMIDAYESVYDQLRS
jgi:D-inositol-3-phosphate glycosyltransferase